MIDSLYDKSFEQAIALAGYQGALNDVESKKSLQRNQEFAKYVGDMNMENWRKQWEATNAYNSPEAQMKRYIDAGINPMMAGNVQPMRSDMSGLPQYQAPQYTPHYTDVTSAFSAVVQSELQKENLALQNKRLEMDNVTALYQQELLASQAYKELANAEAVLYGTYKDKRLLPKVEREYDQNNRNSIANYNYTLHSTSNLDMQRRLMRQEYQLNQEIKPFVVGGAESDVSLKNIEVSIGELEKGALKGEAEYREVLAQIKKDFHTLYGIDLDSYPTAYSIANICKSVGAGVKTTKFILNSLDIAGNVVDKAISIAFFSVGAKFLGKRVQQKAWENRKRIGFE